MAYANDDEEEKSKADVDKAINLNPKHDGAYTLRGWLHYQKKEFEQAIADCTQAIAIDPQSADAYATRGSAHDELKQYDKAVADFAKACELDPEDPDSHNALAWRLATCPKAEVRNGAKAVEHATRACRLTENQDALHLDTLAAAYAESGKFKEAIEWQQRAIAATTEPDERKEYQERLQLYQAGKPYHAK